MYNSDQPDTGQRLHLECGEVQIKKEAAIGIEPMDKGFADLCLTTWLRRLNCQTKEAKATLAGRLSLAFALNLGAGDGI